MFLPSTSEAQYKSGGERTCMHPSVILCGNDNTLLWTRKLVLEQAGFSVRTVRGIEALNGLAGLVLVLCYTLSERERMTATERFRSRFPGARILMLGDHAEIFPPEYCKALTEYPGPEQFVERVSQLAAEASLNPRASA